MRSIFRAALGLCLAMTVLPAAAAAEGEPIVASPPAPLTFETVTFSPSSTAGVTSYGWDLDNDGFFDDATTQSAARSFATADAYTVRLRVSGSNWSSVYSLFIRVGNRAPAAAIAHFPAAPEAGEPVNFVSTSHDPDGVIASLEWDLNGDGVYADASGATASYTFPNAGVATIGLRVVDSDGAAATAAQVVTVAEKPLQFLSPFPLVRVSGKLTARGVRITRLVVQAPVGARVEVRCKGRGCKRHKQTRVAKPLGGGTPRSFRLLRFRRFERALRVHAKLEIYVTHPPTIGKYTRITVRKGLAPLRRDLCILPGAKRPSKCAP